MKRHVDHFVHALVRLRRSQRLFLCLIAAFIYLLSYSTPSSQLVKVKNSQNRALPTCANKEPVIILYQPKVEGADITWNTGVWTGYGEGDEVALHWAAAGVIVKKSCDTKCIFTRDHSLLNTADGVLMELINHPKFLGFGRATRFPIPWPEKLDFQKWILFYFESTAHYSYWTKDLRYKFDYTMTPEQDSDIPITSVCPWGKNATQFLEPPPEKDTENIICDFSKRIPDEYNDYILDFFKIMPVHAYKHHKNKKQNIDQKKYRLSKQLDFVGSYKFTLILETTIEDDWVGGEFSQAFLAGTVPIYLGAPNIHTFSPGPKSFIDIRDYGSAQDLANHINELLKDDEKYMEYFEWKKSGLSPEFQERLNNCYHYAECRLCQTIARNRNCKANDE